MRGVLAASLALLLAGCASPPPEVTPTAAHEAVGDPQAILLQVPPAPLAPGATPWQPGLHDIVLRVDGQEATGLLAVPEGEPAALVLVAHGWGGDAESHRDDLVRLAEHGAVAAAMDYRGARGAFNVRAGVEDTNAATQALQAAYPGVDHTLLYGWSMGGEVALLAAIEAPTGTYDHVFVGAGVTDLQSFWESYPLARDAVEAETGGPPLAVPEEYAARSPVLHAQALAGVGLKRVYVVHAGADPVVPIDHAERLYQALEAAGLPVSFYVMTRSSTALCAQGTCTADLPMVATHDAGAFRFLEPFVLHRIQGLRDPAEAAVRGTYDGYTGEYQPSDAP